MEDDRDEQQYCLRWNNFQANITSQFETLRDDEDFTDVSIVCDGRTIKAHRVVLSACSPLFKELFKNNPCTHPIIFMRDVDSHSVSSLLEFMYAGEVNVAQAHLSNFLRTAESLKIRGLTDPQADGLSNKLVKQSKTPVDPQPNQHNIKQSTPNQHKSTNQDQTRLKQPDLNEIAIETDLECGPQPEPNNETQIQVNNKSPIEEHDVMETDVTMKQMKIELPEFSEYFSDVEVEEDHINNVPGIHESIEMAQSSVHNYKPNTRQGFGVEISEYRGRERSLPTGTSRVCEDCGRTYSNLSNLRQHMRLVHYPTHPECSICQRRFKTDLYLKRHMHNSHHPQQGICDVRYLSCSERSSRLLTSSGRISYRPSRIRNWADFLDDRVPGPEPADTIVKLADGIEIHADQLRSVKWNDYRKLTRGLATILFRPEELASCSVTGQRWSRAGNDKRPVKPALDRAKVQAIISYVASRFPMIEISRIKQVLAYKCKENSTAFKMKAVRYFSDQIRDGNTK